MNIHELAQKYEQYMLDLRHHFHMYPELSAQEEKTSARIQQELDEMGIPYHVDGNRNVIAKIDCGPGPKLAIRSDIDALPMEEEIDWEYKSKVKGVMHACGHDVHTASLLAAAKCLLEVKDRLHGTVYLCFQIAEEASGGGAVEIVKYLKEIGGVDRVISNHIYANVPVGTAVSRPGPMFAGNCRWKITVTGRGGHGSRPDMAIDPIRPAALILNQVCSIPSNYFDPFNPLVISPCMIHSGTAYNIIPDTCSIEGNLRFFRAGQLDEILAHMEKIAKNTADSFGATATLEKLSYCLPVENDPAVTASCEKVIKDIGANYVQLDTPNMGSDDFSEFTNAFPGCYVTFGAMSDRPDASTNHHNTKFFLDEKGFLPVVEYFTAYALEFLK